MSDVQIWGQKKYAMRLWLDPARITAYGLTTLDIQNALNRENVELPSGRIEGNRTELSVRTLGRMTTPEEFNNMIIREQNGVTVRLRDIGYAILGAENERTLLKRDGVPMVGVALVPQPGSNQIAISDEFHKRIAQIKQDLPKTVELKVGFDNTKFIRASISEVQETIMISFGLVVIIIFLFLRDWRSTIIPVLTIPISLVGAFFIMYLAGFSINVLTLLGIVLAIGLVVDDAIVVLENIYAKIEEGMTPFEAAYTGTREIFFAVVATTAVLVAVFLPVVFLQGLTGKLFREFGIVVAGSVVISSFVALTLTPMLSARLLKNREVHPWFYRKTEPFFLRLNDAYRNSLESFMHRRWLALPILVLSSGLIWLLFKSLPSELAPLEDRSAFRIQATGPEGATFEYMDRYLDRLVRTTLDSVSERGTLVSVSSPTFGTSNVNTGFMRVILVDPEERERSQQQIADQLQRITGRFSEARAFVVQEQTISVGGGGGGGAGLPVQFVIQAPTMDKLKEVLPKFLDLARKDPAFTFVDVNLKFNKPELRVEIERDKARAMGVSVADVAQTMQLAFSGQRFGYFIMGGKQYQIIGQAQRSERNDPLDLRSLTVRNTQGELIQLDNLVKLTEESTYPQIYRFNRFVSATVSGAPAPGVTLGQGIEAMDQIADQVLDDTFSRALAGPSRDFAESSSSLLFAFLLALGLIYLVMAAQFESFRDPLIILFTVPLALMGALLSLWYFNQTLNIFSQIGMIMLIGLVTKNGILIVEFANHRRDQGLGLIEAVLEASASRFRPILMTSLCTILGTLPIALALGAGAESRISMGIAVVGGLLISSLLTLFVIPAMYTFLTAKDRSFAPGPEEAASAVR